MAAAGPVVGLAVVCLGALVGPLDGAVNVVFPLLTDAFDRPLADIQSVIIGYVYAQACTQLVFGRLGDLYGHRRVFVLAMAACAAVHLAIGFATTWSGLVALRVVQGIAVGGALACAPALATFLFEPAQKRRVLAAYVMAISLGGALGPMVGGAAAAAFGWAGAFWARVPLALLVLSLLPLVADARAPRAAPSAQHDAHRGRFDWPGALYLAMALGALMLLLVQAGTRGVSPAHAGVALAIGVAAFLAFVRREGRTPSPLLRMQPFRSIAFSALQLASIAINVCCFSIMLLVPYALAARAHWSIAAGGALLALFPAGAVLGALAAARAPSGGSPRTLVRAGLLVAAGGLALTAALVVDGSALALGSALAFAGLGVGIFQVGYFDVTTSLLPAAERGVAASLVNLTRLTGVMLGAAAGSALYAVLQDFQLTIGAFAGGLIAIAGCALAFGRGRD